LKEFLKKKWENKVMHGQYIINIDKQLISEEDTFLWLSKGDLKAETESEIVAAQDQTRQTKYYPTKILQTEKYSKCRLCNQFEETVDHIMSARPILVKEQYINRHDRVCTQLHFNIRKETGVKLDSELRYEHIPNSVETSQVGKVTILWNQQVQTNRIIPKNKPDIIIRDSEKGTCMLIDIAIPGDRNVIKKEAEKILQYKDLTTTAHVECKNKGDPSNNRSKWNHFKILQKMLEQHTRKARYQGTTENSYIGHSTHTSESANVELQKSLILKTALHAPLTVRAE
jgi:hypothetical protein